MWIKYKASNTNLNGTNIPELNRHVAVMAIKNVIFRIKIRNNPGSTVKLCNMIHALVSNKIWSLTCSWSIACRCCSNYIFMLNTLRPRQDGRHFPDDIFICISLNENEWHSIKTSLKFVPKVPIDNIPALVQIMVWHRPGDKPLSEPMMVVLPTHVCVTRPQWVNTWLK